MTFRGSAYQRRMRPQPEVWGVWGRLHKGFQIDFFDLVRLLWAKTNFEEWKSAFWTLKPLEFSSVPLWHTQVWLTRLTKTYLFCLDQNSGELFDFFPIFHLWVSIGGRRNFYISPFHLGGVFFPLPFLAMFPKKSMKKLIKGQGYHLLSFFVQESFPNTHHQIDQWLSFEMLRSIVWVLIKFRPWLFFQNILKAFVTYVNKPFVLTIIPQEGSFQSRKWK